MCGITGFANADKSRVEQTILEKMNAAIIHRGPDQDGFYVKNNIGLAMRRLSIIDLATGKQPIYSEDKTNYIVFNGEIYNYRELRENLEQKGVKFYTNSDTEVIVNLYQFYGVECLKYLRGMFALAIWDETAQSLFLARDRIGKKPLLYSHQPNGDLIFGSEFQALLQHPHISKEIDSEALDAYLNLSCVPAPLTIYKQIRKLEPAHWLLWKNGEIKINRYWIPDFSAKIKISETEAIEETTRILREAVKLRMISEVPLGAFLSGGVDSSTVVALMAEMSEKPVKTFSIGFEEQDFSELKYAKIVAEYIGAEYHEFIVKPNAMDVLPTLVKHYGEPFADSSAVPTYYVAKETRKFVTVALNGDGGDESFGGYERYAAMRLAENYQKIPDFLRKIFINAPINAFSTGELKPSRIKDLKRFIKSAEKSEVERYFGWMSSISPEVKQEFYTKDFRAKLNGDHTAKFLQRYFDKTENLGIIDKLLFVDQQTYLPNDLLPKVDIASMTVSLEARSPFLDHKLIEFAASLPEHYKVNKLTPKYLLKKVAAKLVPREVIYRKKMGFGVPIGYWFRGEMRDFLREVLLSDKSLKRNIIKPDFLQKIVAEHISGKIDNGYQLWTLLMLELWFNTFID